jgi:acyl-CoA synthetase (AMP-forming)/AMP-acid ligase II
MEKGEICAKNKIPFMGYYNDPDKTAEIMKDNYILTGDIGYFDEDEFLHIIDRKKDILKFQGFCVSPSEIESIINEIDLVISSCVVGIEDGFGNDILHAFVQRKNDELKEEDVLDYVKGNFTILYYIILYLHYTILQIV